MLHMTVILSPLAHERLHSRYVDVHNRIHVVTHFYAPNMFVTYYSSQTQYCPPEMSEIFRDVAQSAIPVLRVSSGRYRKTILNSCTHISPSL